MQTSGGLNRLEQPQINTLLGSVNWSNSTAAFFGIDTTNGNYTYNGNITAQPLGLAKLGANTLFLTGVNIPGGTQIDAGVLNIASDAASGAEWPADLRRQRRVAGWRRRRRAGPAATSASTAASRPRLTRRITAWRSRASSAAAAA